MQWLVVFLFCLAAVAEQVWAVSLRGPHGQPEQAGPEEDAEAPGSLAAVLLPLGAMTCSSGQQITTQQDCDIAFRSVVGKGQYDAESDETKAEAGEWRHRPKGCSVSKGKAYFNTDASPVNQGDSAVAGTLSFHVVCSGAAYTQFLHSKFCKGAVLYNGGGLQGEGAYKDFETCQGECDQDPRCKFFLWKNEEGTSWVNHCATFTQCNSPEAYTDGKSARIFRKLDAPSPEKQAEAALKDAVGFYKLQRKRSGSGALRGPTQDKYVGPTARASSAAPPRPAFQAPGVWYACQLVDGHERYVFTPGHMVVMTRTVPDSHGSKLHNTATSFHTGKWSMDGPNVFIKFNKLPPMRLKTSDGGSNFQSTLAPKKREYHCTKPPAKVARLIKAAQKKLKQTMAAARRTDAGAPTDFTQHGCRELSVQPLKSNVVVLSRAMTLSTCFVHCAKTKGMHYFSLTRGDSCFCSATAPGKVVSPESCDLTCSGKGDEYCGGFANFVSVYTMIDCVKPSPLAIKEMAARRSARVRGLYSMRKSESCGRAPGNDVEVEGAPVKVATPKECEELCLGGRGAGKCNGFTYNSLQNKCTFHMDAFWGKPVKEAYYSCYFKRSVPLLG